MSPRYIALYAFGFIVIIVIPAALYVWQGRTPALTAFGIGLVAYFLIDGLITFWKHRTEFSNAGSADKDAFVFYGTPAQRKALQEKRNPTLDKDIARLNRKFERKAINQREYNELVQRLLKRDTQ